MLIKEKNLKELVIKQVNKIPSGMVANYGLIGESIGVSGRTVGFVLSSMKQESWDALPWWRVVAKTGLIPTLKLGPKGMLQLELLKEEGHTLENNQIMHNKFVTEL